MTQEQDQEWAIAQVILDAMRKGYRRGGTPITAGRYRLYPLEGQGVFLEQQQVETPRLLSRIWSRLMAGARKPKPDGAGVITVQYVLPYQRGPLGCDVCGHRVLGWEMAPMLEPRLPCRWRCSECGAISIAIDADASLSKELVKPGGALTQEQDQEKPECICPPCSSLRRRGFPGLSDHVQAPIVVRKGEIS